jgi:hypothetical protein
VIYDAKFANVWWPQPTAGDITWCWTPWVSPPEPGPIKHPALIYRVRKHPVYDGYEVWIAPGTSKKIEQLFPGDFLVGQAPTAATRLEVLAEETALKAAGLTKPTKFQLGAIVLLDYNSDFFSVPGWVQGVNTPKMGRLQVENETLRIRLSRAKEAVGLTGKPTD